MGREEGNGYNYVIVEAIAHNKVAEDNVKTGKVYVT
jgi:hypothetical protein